MVEEQKKVIDTRLGQGWKAQQGAATCGTKNGVPRKGQSFWMHHGHEYEGVSYYCRSRVFSALVASLITLLATSAIVVPMIFVFSGFNFSADAFLIEYPVLEIFAIFIFCGRTEFFRKLYEGLRMYPFSRDVLAFTIGSDNIIYRVMFYRFWR
jgi:hypothetical protein